MRIPISGYSQLGIRENKPSRELRVRENSRFNNKANSLFWAAGLWHYRLIPVSRAKAVHREGPTTEQVNWAQSFFFAWIWSFKPNFFTLSLRHWADRLYYSLRLGLLSTAIFLLHLWYLRALLFLYFSRANLLLRLARLYLRQRSFVLNT